MMLDVRHILSCTITAALAFTLGCKQDAPTKDAESKDTTPKETSANEGHQGRDALAKEEGPEPITPKKVGTLGEDPGADADADKSALNNLAGAVTNDSAFVAAKPHPRPEDGVTFLTWGPDGELLLGFGDGRLATVDVDGKKADIEVLSKDGASIEAISPDTKLAVLGTSPPRLIKREGQADVLTFSYLENLEGVSFSPDSQSMFLASHEGPMRAWKDLGKMTSDLEGEVRLQDYVARLQGDLRVNFGPMGESLASADGPNLAYTEPSGQIVWWDMNKPTEALYVLRLEPPIRSMSLIGEHLVATNERGDMRVSIVQQRNMRRWSMSQKAYLVAGDPADSESFVALYKDHIARHNIETGEVIWRQTLETDGADLCGMSVKSDKDIVAVCDKQKVALFNHKDGSSIGSFHREGDQILWE